MFNAEFVVLQLEKSSSARLRKSCSPRPRNLQPLRRQIRQFSRPRLAAENVDQIAQGSPCGRVHEQGRYCRAGDFPIDATDAVIGLRNVPQKSKTCGQNRPLLPSFGSTAKPTPPPSAVTSSLPRPSGRGLSPRFCSAYSAF